MPIFVFELYYGFLLWHLEKSKDYRWLWVWPTSGLAYSVSYQEECDFLDQYYLGE